MKNLADHINESLTINENAKSDGIIVMVKKMSEILKQFHHNTDSFAEHKAFDDIYTAFEEIEDDIVERIIGYTGDRYNTIPVITNSQPYDFQSTTIVVDALNNLGTELINFAKEFGYFDLENYGQTIHGLGAKLSYLLTLK